MRNCAALDVDLNPGLEFVLLGNDLLVGMFSLDCHIQGSDSTMHAMDVRFICVWCAFSVRQLAHVCCVMCLDRNLGRLCEQAGGTSGGRGARCIGKQLFDTISGFWEAANKFPLLSCHQAVAALQ
jgi:hypothetical protein